MKTIQVFDAETVQLQLASGDSAQISDALQQIDAHLQRPLCGGLRGTGAPLSSHDMPIVWNQTLREIWRSAQANNINLNKKLESWIFTILKNRAIDCLRQRTRHAARTDEHKEHVNREALRRQMPTVSDVELEEAIQLGVESFDSLPPKQCIVMKAYFSGRPATEEMKVLCEEVSKITGKVETVVGVTRALQEARIKVKEHLIQKGFLGRSSRD